LARYHRRALSTTEAEPLIHEVASVAIAQQRRCGLDQITGGETAADSLILHVPRELSGIAPTEDTAAWDGRGTYRIVGSLDAPAGVGIARAFRREHANDPGVAKAAYRSEARLARDHPHRRALLQLLWCLEYAALTPGHHADTAAVCAALNILAVQFGHVSHVTNVAFDPAGRCQAGHREDSYAKGWDVGMGRALWTLAGHTSGVLGAHGARTAPDLPWVWPGDILIAAVVLCSPLASTERGVPSG